MSTDETYNGWANRETWALALHINNDQGWQEQVHEIVREFVRSEIGDEKYNPNADDAGSFSEDAGAVIRENVESLLTVDGYNETTGEENLPASLSRIAEDIGSLYRVDWREIGAAFLADLDES